METRPATSQTKLQPGRKAGCVYTKLLIPLDGSQNAETILPYAIELAKHCESHVTLLEATETLEEVIATLEPAEPVGMTPQVIESMVEGVEGEKDEAERYLTRVVKRLRAEGLDVDEVTVEGAAGPAIVHYVAEHGIDVIAMSSHGRGGVARALLGSVTDHVMQHVSVPVLVLRSHGDK